MLKSEAVVDPGGETPQGSEGNISLVTAAVAVAFRPFECIALMKASTSPFVTVWPFLKPRSFDTLCINAIVLMPSIVPAIFSTGTADKHK